MPAGFPPHAGAGIAPHAGAGIAPHAGAWHILFDREKYAKALEGLRPFDNPSASITADTQKIKDSNGGYRCCPFHFR
ncbi:MAG: hypothetical protein RR049_02735 [Angelakisella sp.]